MTREFPGCGLFFWSKWRLDTLLGLEEETRPGMAMLKKILAGGLAGCFTWSIGLPLDSVKSFIQTYPTKLKMSEAINLIYARNGLYGFYFGLAPTLIRSFPTSAVLFLSFDFTKDLLS